LQVELAVGETLMDLPAVAVLVDFARQLRQLVAVEV
jgi:hypothetical protein